MEPVLEGGKRVLSMKSHPINASVVGAPVVGNANHDLVDWCLTLGVEEKGLDMVCAADIVLSLAEADPTRWSGFAACVVESEARNRWLVRFGPDL